MKSVFVKREYDRLHQQKLYEEYKIRREKVYVMLGNKCELCDGDKRKHFHLHHRYYHPIESNYPRHSNAMNVRFKRLKEAENCPERFALLCPTCHRVVTAFEFKKLKLEVLLKLIEPHAYSQK